MCSDIRVLIYNLFAYSMCSHPLETAARYPPQREPVPCRTPLAEFQLAFIAGTGPTRPFAPCSTFPLAAPAAAAATAAAETAVSRCNRIVIQTKSAMDR